MVQTTLYNKTIYRFEFEKISRELENLTDETSSANSSVSQTPITSTTYIHSPTINKDKAGVSFIRVNGCKTYGPPNNWTGAPPPVDCEIFVKGIPRNTNDVDILALFQKYGQVYELRIMVDFANNNRGFGFIRYTRKEEVQRAIEVLNLFYVQPFKMLNLVKSLNKCQLYVGNIPNSLDTITIEEGLRNIFPEMLSFNIPNESQFSNKQRHYVFVNFADHATAVRAKQYTSTGRFRILNHDLKIAWANQDHPVSNSLENVIIF